MRSSVDSVLTASQRSDLFTILLDRFDIQDANLELIAGEGSDRIYIRIENPVKTMLLMIYGSEKAENGYFLHIRQFLASIQINVPDVLYADTARCWIFLEDIGSIHVFNRVQELDDANSVIELYKQIIDGITPLYTQGCHIYKEKPFVTAPPFDEHLYRWEHNYFIENYLSRHLQFTGDVSGVKAELDVQARYLASRENRLIHRDLQSKNCMIYNDRIYFIDFQGLRPGLPDYDMASLLFDPYVALSEDVRSTLIDYYFEESNREFDKHLFLKVFYMCAAQRLMQALGAYGFLGIVKGKTQFLTYMQPAHTLLRQVLAQNGLLPSLLKVLG